MEPTARRPYMPGYGIAAADEGGGLLPWSWAEQRLAASHDYWVATVCPDGRPHVTPVWGVWSDGTFAFSCGGGSRKARNLSREPRATVTTADPNEPVIVEGTAERVAGEEAVTAFVRLLNAKYGTADPVEFFLANAVLRLTPSVAFGLAQANFTGSPTRWEFQLGGL